MARWLQSLILALVAVTAMIQPAFAQPEPQPTDDPAPAPEPGPPEPAQPEPDPDGVKNACLASFKRSQSLRHDRKLLQAKDEMVACAQQACPPLIVAKCQTWLGEIKDSVPTVVFAARVKGVDVFDVKVYVDDVLRLDSLTGVSIELDPGPRKIRAVRGVVTRERTVLIREGEKNRVIELDFNKKKAPPKPHKPKPKKPVTPEPGFSMPIMSWIGFSVGIVGVVLGSITGGIALAKADTLKDECNAGRAGVCGPPEKDDLNGGLAAAHISTVSFAIGGAGIGLGVIGLFVGGDEPDKPDVRGVAVTGTF